MAVTGTAAAKAPEPKAAESSEPKVLGKIEFVMPSVQGAVHSTRYFTADGNLPDGKSSPFKTVYVDKLALAERGLPIGNVIRVTVEVFENVAEVKPLTEGQLKKRGLA